MQRTKSIWFSAIEPANEWHDFSYLDPAKSHRAQWLVSLLVLWIAILDVCLRSNYSILYVVPVILLARTGGLSPLWRSVGILVVLTYGIFFLKGIVNPPPHAASFFDFRLVNRTLVVLMILGIGRMLQLWNRWREEQSDPEVPEGFRFQDQEISATFAVLTCAPLLLLIAAIDFVSPANYNLPILYPIPLFICAWTGSRRLLWCMLTALLLLTVTAFLFGRPSTIDVPDFGLERNRLLAITAMVSVTVALHYWMDRDPHRSA